MNIPDPDLRAVLKRVAGKWTHINNAYLKWTSDSPVGYSERTLMGTLLRAFERAYPKNPCLCEVPVEGRNTRGARIPDLWFCYKDHSGGDVDVYVEGKVVWAKWNKKTGAFEWWNERGEKGKRYKKRKVTALALANLASKQLGQIKRREGYKSRTAIALFVVFEISTENYDPPSAWNERFRRHLDRPREYPATQEHWDFAPSHWKNIRQSAEFWKQPSFMPRARLFLYEHL